jgi:hypothetical protein
LTAGAVNPSFWNGELLAETPTAKPRANCRSAIGWWNGYQLLNPQNHALASAIREFLVGRASGHAADAIGGANPRFGSIRVGGAR